MADGIQSVRRVRPPDEQGREEAPQKVTKEPLEQWVVQDEIPKAIREGKYGCEEDGDPAAVAYMAAAEVVFSKRKAVVADGSQYHAELLTRPDFGCVLHEAS